MWAASGFTSRGGGELTKIEAPLKVIDLKVIDIWMNEDIFVARGTWENLFVLCRSVEKGIIFSVVHPVGNGCLLRTSLLTQILPLATDLCAHKASPGGGQKVSGSRNVPTSPLSTHVLVFVTHFE